MHFWLNQFRVCEGTVVTDYGAFSFEDKQEVLDKAKEFWNPGKTQFWIDSGTPLVIDRREGYLLWDMTGRRLIDAHLNGGTYNVGHRNREVVAAVAQAMHRFDIGNHHFPSLARTALAEALVRSAPATGSGGCRCRSGASPARRRRRPRGCGGPRCRCRR